VVLIRSLVGCIGYFRRRKSRDRVDEHLRCHGTTQRRLTRFRDGAGPFEVPYIRFYDSTLASP
jgi:hypothetical protein